MLTCKNNEKLSKTEKVINLLFTLLNAKSNQITEEELIDALGTPSRAQRYKIIKELIKGTPIRPPIIEKSGIYFTFSKNFKEMLNDVR